MIGVSVYTRWLCGGLILVASAAVGVFSVQSSAAAASSLSSVVLSQSVPGLVSSPPGIRNGPINGSNLDFVTGGANGPAETQFAQQLASGDVGGYIRTWEHQPANGDGVVISAFRFQDPSQAASFVGGEKGSLSQQPGISPLAVSSVAGATGYLVHTSASSIPVTEYMVVFDKANTVFTVSVVTVSGDLTAADATNLASRQWTAVATPTNWTPIIRLVDVVGGLLLSLIIVLAARTRRYPTIFTARPIARGVGPWGSPLPSRGPL